MKFKHWLNEMAIQPDRTEPYRVGEVLTIVNPRGEKHEFQIRKIENGYAWISPLGYEHLAKMPLDSLKHFVNDLSGKVNAEKESGNSYIDAVLNGKAEYLGKGDDGVAFRVGDMVVKVSTTVPFHPLNPGHRHPGDAMLMMKHETDMAKKLIAVGVPGILSAEYIEHGDKVFQIRPYVAVPSRLNLRQLTQIRNILKALHALGYVVGDEIQAGIYQGQVYLYDLGKVRKADQYGIEDDISSLKRLYKNSGYDYEPDFGDALKQEYESVRNHLSFLARIKSPKDARVHFDRMMSFYQRFRRLVDTMHEEFPEVDTSPDEAAVGEIAQRFGLNKE